MQLAYPSHVILANTRLSFEDTYLDLSREAKRLMPTYVAAGVCFCGLYYIEGDT